MVDDSHVTHGFNIVDLWAQPSVWTHLRVPAFKHVIGIRHLQLAICNRMTDTMSARDKHSTWNLGFFSNLNDTKKDQWNKVKRDTIPSPTSRLLRCIRLPTLQLSPHTTLMSSQNILRERYCIAVGWKWSKELRQESNLKFITTWNVRTTWTHKT